MRIYKPAPSHGALYILGMAILIVLLSLPVIPAMATPVGPVLIITAAVIMWPLAIAGCLIAWWFRSMQKAILLIRTPRRLYGITPADEEAFVADLTARLRG